MKNEKEQDNRSKINYRQLALGLLLNILTIIVFILLYHAYIVEPRIEVSNWQGAPIQNTPMP
jgi:hypothetical protein